MTNNIGEVSSKHLETQRAIVFVIINSQIEKFVRNRDMANTFIDSLRNNISDEYIKGVVESVRAELLLAFDRRKHLSDLEIAYLTKDAASHVDISSMCCELRLDLVKSDFRSDFICTEKRC